MGGPDETLWHYTNADGRFHRTGLRNQLDGTGAAGSGPRDPVFSVLVDPGDVTGNTVYAGTVTGVWKGTRTTATGPLTWVPYVNGLPQASVQDLDIWSNPGGGASTPRLLRAGVQSRGVWEVDLAHDAVRQTWIRSHRWDDRRNPLTIHTDPFQAPPALPVSLAASPDVVVRPRWTTTTPPAFVAGPKITSVNSPAYDVWTFQTAFRWLYPSVAANGQFSDALGRLVALHRTGMAPAKTAVPEIDALVWADVVGGVRVKADGTVTTDTADPLAVYRAPWQTSRAPTVGATEADLLDLVVPRGVVNDLWTVFREPSTVDVLVHHRDALGLSAGQGFVILLWRSGATPAALMAESVTTLLPFLTAAAGGTAQAAHRRVEPRDDGRRPVLGHGPHRGRRADAACGEHRRRPDAGHSGAAGAVPRPRWLARRGGGVRAADDRSGGCEPADDRERARPVLPVCRGADHPHRRPAHLSTPIPALFVPGLDEVSADRLPPTAVDRNRRPLTSVLRGGR